MGKKNVRSVTFYVSYGDKIAKFTTGYCYKRQLHQIKQSIA